MKSHRVEEIHRPITACRSTVRWWSNMSHKCIFGAYHGHHSSEILGSIQDMSKYGSASWLIIAWEWNIVSWLGGLFSVRVGWGAYCVPRLSFTTDIRPTCGEVKVLQLRRRKKKRCCAKTPRKGLKIGARLGVYPPMPFFGFSRETLHSLVFIWMVAYGSWQLH